MADRRIRSIGKAALLLLSVMVFLSGLVVALYPTLNGIWIDYTLRRDAEEFLSFVYTDRYVPEVEEPYAPIQNTEATKPEETLPRDYPELWQEMKAYNEAIYASGQEGLSNAAAYETPSFILSDYGLASEVFAVISM